jgi:hypothetical protein
MPTPAAAMRLYLTQLRSKLNDLVLNIPREQIEKAMNGVHKMSYYLRFMEHVVLGNPVNDKSTEDHIWPRVECQLLRAQLRFAEARITSITREMAFGDRQVATSDLASCVLKTLGIYKKDHSLCACKRELLSSLKLSLSQRGSDASEVFREQRQSILILLSETCFLQGNICDYRRYVSLGEAARTKSSAMNNTQSRFLTCTLVLQSIIENRGLKEAEDMAVAGICWDSDQLSFMHLILLHKRGALTFQLARALVSKIRGIRRADDLLMSPKGLRFFSTFLLPEMVFNISTIDAVLSVLASNGVRLGEFEDTKTEKQVQTVIRLICLAIQSKTVCQYPCCRNFPTVTCQECMQSFCSLTCIEREHGCEPLVALLGT